MEDKKILLTRKRGRRWGKERGGGQKVCWRAGLRVITGLFECTGRSGKCWPDSLLESERLSEFG